MAVELIPKQFSDKEALGDFIVSKLEYLVTARPTAVNMTDSAKWFTAKVKDYVQQSIFSVEEIKNR